MTNETATENKAATTTETKVVEAPIPTTDTPVNAVVVFDANEIATLGNKFLTAILVTDTAKGEAEAILAEAENRDSIIDAELIKAAMFLHGEEKIDLMATFGDNKQIAALNRALLVSIGVLRRVIDDGSDTVRYVWTDPALEAAYEFSNYDADKQPEQFKRARSNRNSLNIRLSRACKAALALVESGASVSDIRYRVNKANVQEVVLIKGPAEVMGKNAEVVISTRNAAVAEGASNKPTIGGIAKVAETKHKASKQAIEPQAQKQEEGARNENDFVALINTVLMAVKGKEGKFTDSEKMAVSNLLVTMKENGLAVIKKD